MIARVCIVLSLSVLVTACICAPGHVACDDGCVDVSTDVSNCGGCGNVCDGRQICLEGACVGSTGPRCDEDRDCGDDVHCNGEERCVGGSCRQGRAVVCDDGIMCTNEVCVERARACVATAVHTRCGAGKTCVGGTSDADACR